jgi:hypothetical protein
MRDKRRLAAVLKQADKFNAEGFGLYFAPCLRREKKGSADSAAWVPALWIDIDGDEQHRQRDLEKLRGFDPAPSFIVSSGADGTVTGCWTSRLCWKQTNISSRSLPSCTGCFHP